MLDEALFLPQAMLPIESPKGVTIGEGLPDPVLITKVLVIRGVDEPRCPGIPECGRQFVVDVVSEAGANKEALEVRDVVTQAWLYLEGSKPLLVQRDRRDELCPAFDIGALRVGDARGQEECEQ